MPVWIYLVLVVVLLLSCPATSSSRDGDGALPAARRTGSMSVEQAMAQRRSVRALRADPLTSAEIAQLLWAAQGTSRPGRRTAPSAGALYPLETYLVTARGVGRYDPRSHRLVPHLAGDRRAALQGASLDQDPVRYAPVVIVFAAVYGRTERKYGSRAARYVHMEVGHAGQNVLLQATALGLAGVPIGAFDDAQVARVLQLPRSHKPLYVIPLGRPR